ncbi:WAP four-disulfide core domain protein 13 [Panthera tigris]|uniref:WAP four-disulfide core domain protein 13 n=1 Tax=Panthera tigris TaxID=9694 RepID=UPI00042C1596|nr:WAP four-disulfide core domain protein 13 [Panthera tigris]XP_042786007.1 WAP four-disulfide core domain protein 13 [Panthera leo]
MKPVLFLQLLLLIHLAPQRVPGSPKQHFMRSILEPPPCKSDPENCTHFCTLQEDCHKGFQCCSAFCGIVCTLNINIKHDSPAACPLENRSPRLATTALEELVLAGKLK